MTDAMVFGLQPEAQLPEGWTPLEAVVTVKCLDSEGDVAMHHTATPDLNTWEAIGMLRWTQLALDAAITGDDD